MKDTLNQIENRLQKIIETSIRLVPGSEKKQRLAQQLVDSISSMVDEISIEELDQPLAVTIHLNPVDFVIWEPENDIAAEFSGILRAAALDAGKYLRTAPAVRLEVDNDLREGIVHVSRTVKIFETRQTPLHPVGEGTFPESLAERKAFLIINDERVYMIEGSVVNIGRRSDNHLVLDDSRISRLHAQIRMVHNNHVIFDLNSTAGTRVNGNRIERHTLRPGDVISIGGVPLVYGEDLTAKPDNTGQTASLPSQSVTPGKGYQ